MKQRGGVVLKDHGVGGDFVHSDTRAGVAGTLGWKFGMGKINGWRSWIIGLAAGATLVLLSLHSTGFEVENGVQVEPNIHDAQSSEQIDDEEASEGAHGDEVDFESDAAVAAVSGDADVSNEALREIEAEVKRLSLEAEEELIKPRNCLPKLCGKPFRMRGNPSKTGKALLVSLPGSGNTWMRSITRTGTRMFTGSMYKDMNLFKKGFEAELFPPNSPKSLIVKAHFPYHGGYFPYDWVDAAIHVARSPTDAFIAECQRAVSRNDHTGAGKWSDEELKQKCRVFIKKVAYRGKRVYRWWAGATLEEKRQFRGMKDLILIRMKPSKKRFPGRGFPVATMFYEDFTRDFARAAIRYFAFLKVIFPQHPRVVNSVLCTISDAKKFENIQRKKHPTFNLYHNGTALSDVGNLLCKDIFEDWWNPHKWGPQCDGVPQSKEKQPFALQVNVPDEICT